MLLREDGDDGSALFGEKRDGGSAGIINIRNKLKGKRSEIRRYFANRYLRADSFGCSGHMIQHQRICPTFTFPLYQNVELFFSMIFYRQIESLNIA